MKKSQVLKDMKNRGMLYFGLREMNFMLVMQEGNYVFIWLILWVMVQSVFFIFLIFPVSSKAHDSDITSMRLLEAKETIVTASKDKNMKVNFFFIVQNLTYVSFGIHLKVGKMMESR